MTIAADAVAGRPADELERPEIGRQARTAWFRRHIHIVTWIALCCVALVVLERLRSPTTFFYDEWAFVFERREGGLDSLLRGHNGHLSLLPVLAYRIGFWLFGLDHYRPFRVGGLLVHILVATVAFRYVARQLGQLAGIAAGGLVLFLGSGWQDIVWPFQIGFMGSVAAAIGAWLLLDRRDRRGDVGATVAVGLSLACSGLGISVVAGTLARLAAERAWRRTLFVLGPPVALYAVWYLAYGESQGSSDNVPLIPRFVVDAGGWSAAALAGRDLLWGRLWLGLLIGALVTICVQWRGKSWRILAPAVTVTVNWVLLAYSRADLNLPGSSRYVYVGAVFIILLLADLLREQRGPILTGLIVSAALLGVWGNWKVLHDGASGQRWASHITRSELRALEWARDTVDPDYRPDLDRMPQVFAGQYLDAVADLGSAGATDGEVAVTDNEARSAVDRVSLGALRFAPTPTVLPPINPTDATNAGPPSSLGTAQCVTFQDLNQPVQLSLVAGGQVVISSDQAIEVRLRRYADTYPDQPSAVIAAAQPASIVITKDAAPNSTWLAELRSAAPVTACGPAP